MVCNLITLVLATLPLVATADKTCVSKTKYTLNIFTGKNVAPLHAIDNGRGDVLLVADTTVAAPGTTLSEVGNNPNKEVDLEVDHATEPFATVTGIYHLSVPDLGEARGTAAPVMGTRDTTWAHWFTNTEHVWPQQTSGAQVFFACKINLNGREYTALSWGLAGSDGSMPEGCQGTYPAKVYDVRIPC